jgi:hypothetical protein
MWMSWMLIQMRSKTRTLVMHHARPNARHCVNYIAARRRDTKLIMARRACQNSTAGLTDIELVNAPYQRTIAVT